MESLWPAPVAGGEIGGLCDLYHLYDAIVIGREHKAEVNVLPFLQHSVILSF